MYLRVEGRNAYETRADRPLDQAFFARLTGWTRLDDRVVLEFAEGGKIEVYTSQPICWIEPPPRPEPEP